MDNVIKKILDNLEKQGFKAYVVGGYVRDYLLGIKSYDVDICTNALPKDIYEIFKLEKKCEYGSVSFKVKNYNIDITTFRRELEYNNRKPINIEYIDSLEEDVLRRDFTINSICMDKKGKIIDLANGVNDLNNHTIKVVGDISKKITEDPLRILRAIRFASVLNFKIDKSLDKCITDNFKLVGTLSEVRIKNELNKILINKNYLTGLELLKKYKILDLLMISYDDIIYVNDICGMWAQLNVKSSYAFTKNELNNIKLIKNIVKKGYINNITLYNNDLYVCSVAAEILNLNKKKITKAYDKLPIKSSKDVDITAEEIKEILGTSKISEVFKMLEEGILQGYIKNKNKVLRDTLLLWREDVFYEK